MIDTFVLNWRHMRRIVLLLIPLIFLGLGCRKGATPAVINAPPSPSPVISTARVEKLGSYFTIRASDEVYVNGLTIKVNVINSLTAQGCEGGPIGCPDNVELIVKNQSSETQTFSLAVLSGSKPIASSERIIFGHKFILSSVAADSAVLGIFLAPAETTSPTPR